MAKQAYARVIQQRGTTPGLRDAVGHFIIKAGRKGTGRTLAGLTFVNTEADRRATMARLIQWAHEHPELIVLNGTTTPALSWWERK